jgi:hypothetical protein
MFSMQLTGDTSQQTALTCNPCLMTGGASILHQTVQLSRDELLLLEPQCEYSM